MRKRLIAGGAVVLLIVGAWLGNLFKGFGVGGSESGTGNEAEVNLTAPTEAHTETPQQVETPAVEPETSPVLTVLVDADQFRIQSGSDASATFATATLDEIVKRARESTGDEHGVRVRLRFRENAQNGATSDLFKALQERAGIDREAIVEAPGFVE